ncbi:segregation and condensation protein A [Candidatus Venteria ishoeyi]|uniref:Segregation and condensation protein A n=1 Tax=Candidatus Venteria ishoeyi TaxID=1899563 RepID=A0A1H6FC62_9GAMM|nr:ScpA family protein [Candidatus Venteria ishoeyi]SEH06736.1 Segregation and condensation protein A [Candidatus Venteria ishoeyi]
MSAQQIAPDSANEASSENISVASPSSKQEIQEVADSISTEPVQEVLALVEGEAITELPGDLYIPPDALQIFLETFEGPLDLLLYLIQRQDLDILNIPVTKITQQYLQYIKLMRELELNLAGEYLVMAALLLEIKSRLLLPRDEEEDGEEEADPRKQLVQQLQEYARFKKAAEDIGQLPAMGVDTFLLDVEMPPIPQTKKPPKIPLEALLQAMQDVLLRIEMHSAHQISREPLSVRERMTQLLELLSQHPELDFQLLFNTEEGRAGVVVAFLASLELVKEKLVNIRQEYAFGPIQLVEKLEMEVAMEAGETGETGENTATDA